MIKEIYVILIISILSRLEQQSSAFRVETDEDIIDQQDDRAYPEHEMFVSRRRQDPVMEDDSQVDILQNSDSKSFKFVSNLSPSLQAVIDTKVSKDLPANYHNSTIYILQHNGKTVRVNVTINKVTNPKTGFESISVVETANDTTFGFDCSESTPCQAGMYCREMLVGHFCSKCKNLDERCNSDIECCGKNTREALCVDHVCKNGYEKGEEGTICEHPKDCNPGFCCANKFMAQSTCKPLAKIGERCLTRYTELNSIMDGGICPCKGGLICSHSSSNAVISSIFEGFPEDVLGDTKCSAKPKQKGTWFSGLLDNLDEEDEGFNI